MLRLHELEAIIYMLASCCSQSLSSLPATVVSVFNMAPQRLSLALVSPV
jgi:hypothetical protein